MRLSTSPSRTTWRLISTVCFADPNIDGTYLTEADYGALYRLAPNLHCAFELADEAFSAARKTLRLKLDEEKKREKAATEQ